MVQAVQRAFETIRMAKVSQHAPDAAAIGYLRASDVIAANPDHLLYRAKAEALALSEEKWFTHAEPVQLPVLGESGRAALVAPVEDLGSAGKATAPRPDYCTEARLHSLRRRRRSRHAQDESHFIDLEREAFVSLCGEPRPKTASPTSSRPANLCVIRRHSL